MFVHEIRHNHWTMKYTVTITYVYFEVKRLNIPSHNLKVSCPYIKQSSRYKAKSLYREI